MLTRGRQNYFGVVKILFFSILSYLNTNVVNASQTLAKFFGNEQKSHPNASLYWYNMNKQGFASIDTPLSLQQESPSSYYLYADAPPTVTSITAAIQAQDKLHNNVQDIQILSADTPGTCNFTYEDNGWFCKVTLLASENSPLNDNNDNNHNRVIYTYPPHNGRTDFFASSQPVNISLASKIGSIVGIGPDQVPNVLTAIAASDNPNQDNVTLTFKIERANPVVKSLKLNFEFEDQNIASTNGARSGSCLIQTISNRTGFCTLEVTPQMVGKTKIKLLASSTWTDTKDHSNPLNVNDYQAVQVNVGTLFAGYNALSTNRKLYRKGSELTNIREPSEVGIHSLAIDEPQHKLYVLTKNNAYRQANVTESQLELSKLAEIPGSAAQTLSLTDVPNRILIGSGDSKLYEVQDKQAGASVKRITNAFSSITNTSLDPFDNVVYFADQTGGISAYYSNYATSNKSLFMTMSEEINNLIDYKVAAHHGQLYAAASSHPPLSGSKLFVWRGDGFDGQMHEVMLKESSNPFKPQLGGNKITSLFFTRQGNLYASGSNGSLYRLLQPRASKPQWELLTTIGIKRPSDSAVDANGNIYLSSDEGVWKVPFDNPKQAYKLNNYATNISTIVVDNNRDVN